MGVRTPKIRFRVRFAKIGGSITLSSSWIEHPNGEASVCKPRIARSVPQREPFNEVKMTDRGSVPAVGNAARYRRCCGHSASSIRSADRRK